LANVDEKVLAAVEAALKKNPGTSVDELMVIAKGVSPAISKLSKRQFHARYPLQVKRRMSAVKGGRRRSRKPAPRKGSAQAAAGAREAVRGAFLRFATDLAGAEARKDVVKVVAGVDKYVDEVLKAAGAS
jgi:hypothetical protein